jgi:hypothetical protein
MTLTIDNFELIFSEKKNSKFNISFTLGPKITKSPPRDQPLSSRAFQQYQELT